MYKNIDPSKDSMIVKRLLDRSQYIKMTESKKVSASLAKIWKKSFSSIIIIPTKMRFCIESKNERMGKKFNNLVNESKEFEANLNILKREFANDFGHMLPYFKE